MDLIFTRIEDGEVSGGILSHYTATFDITTDLEYVTNKFELNMSIPISREGLLYREGEIKTIIFIEGTEFGGEVTGYQLDEEDGTITYTGRTWRGEMSKDVIEPPAGEDYLVTSGNLADSLRALPMSGYYQIENTEYTGGEYQYNRYIKTFEGATNLLKAARSDLRMTIEFESILESGKAHLTIEPARDLRDLIEMSQDYDDNICLKIKKDGDTPRHLICLGQGELHEREVIHLYADDDWNITQTPIPGARPVDVYDYSASNDLLGDGTKHFEEIIGNHTQIDASVSDFGIRLSDIISGKDQITGESVDAEITSIILRIDDKGESHIETYEYKTKVRL